MSSVTGHTAHSVERPERSRNAKAQARHRAKRKAYIEQLEQTVTKLQTALGFTPEQVAALPPPLAKIRELEQENARLLKENEEFRRLLADSGTRVMPLRTGSAFHDTRNCDREPYKRRKMSGEIDSVYMGSENSSQSNDMRAPPPLTIPQPTSHHYSNLSAHPSNHSSTGSLFNLTGPAFQMPNTPSGSSSTSSPPFSPAQMQTPSVSPVNHRPTLPSHHLSTTYSNSQYVKVEDENSYASSNHHHSSHNNHYSLPPFGHTDHAMESGGWPPHTYSSERVAIHPTHR